MLSSDTDQIQFGTVNYKADALALHPGIGAFPDPTNDLAVVRWIAPSTDLYNLSFEFLPLDSSTSNSADGTVVGLYVLPSVAPAAPAVIATSPLGPGLGPSFGQSYFGFSATAGNVIDFVVWRGLNASQDTTGLRATFTVVPEPGTYALVGCGLLGIALWRSRRTA